MSVIRTNQPNFFGNYGEPLQSGYIYIGQPRQDPTSFPKTVTFQDSQGVQQTAHQPLRTNAQGQITYNGKSQIALVDGDYSMLILDSTQTQIAGGNIPLVEPDDSSGSSDEEGVRRFSLILADVKKLAVTPGQTVGSIGKLTATDSLGVDWLVAANTGSTADDIDLIDFDNGLQGVKLKNFTEEAATSADKLAVRNNIDVYSKTQTDAAYISTAPSSVNTANLAPSSVTSSELANNSVFSNAIADSNVTNSKIPNQEIKSSKLNYSLNSFSTTVAAASVYTLQLDSDFVLSPIFNEDFGVLGLIWYLHITASPNGPELVIYNPTGGGIAVSGGILTILF